MRRFAITNFTPQLIILDKDGTLIDFHAMWAAWIREVARRLEHATGLALAEQLFRVMDFDAPHNYLEPTGTLAVTPMAELRRITANVLRVAGLTESEVTDAMQQAWHAPDPITLAYPLTDLVALFSNLHEYGMKIAIATSDDRASTIATLQALKLTPLVDALVCADDGLPIKPAPDMILHVCQQLAINPAQTMMVGDSVHDMEMGKAAKVGLVIGVLSGVSPRERLAPYADVIINSVGELFA
jgi:choline dehydrogenase